MTADDEHRERLVRALESCREIDAVDVQVSVKAGCVTLSGEVGSMAERLAARSIVVNDPASVDVVDELWASPLPGEWRLTDPEITQLVAERLRHHAELAAVHPSCDFHVVHLDGVVADSAARRIAHHLARTTRGVHFVVDRIAVTPSQRDVEQAAS